MKHIIKYVVFFVLLYSCSNKQNDVKYYQYDNIWHINISESKYYEFYFDDNDQYLFNSNDQTTYKIDFSNPSRNKTEIRKIRNIKNKNKYDSAIIYYIKKYIIKDEIIKNIYSVGILMYREHNVDNYDYNYLLFSQLAYSRWKDNNFNSSKQEVTEIDTLE